MSPLRVTPGIFALFSLMPVSCVTPGHQEPPQVPAVLHPLFTPCAPGDGASTMQVWNGDQLLGSVEVDWLAKDGGDWDLEANSSVGLSVLKLGRSGHKIKASGGISGKLPKVGVRKDGFLMIDDHMVGLKASELPCLLAFRLPRPWLNHVQDVTNVDGKILVTIADAERDIEISAKGLSESEPVGQVCSHLEWNSFLFFSSRLAWCQTVTGKQEASLKGVDDYSLKWVRIDESH